MSKQAAVLMAFIEGHQRGEDTQGLSTQPVIMFGIVAGVSLLLCGGRDLLYT